MSIFIFVDCITEETCAVEAMQMLHIRKTKSPHHGFLLNRFKIVSLCLILVTWFIQQNIHCT